MVFSGKLAALVALMGTAAATMSGCNGSQAAQAGADFVNNGPPAPAPSTPSTPVDPTALYSGPAEVAPYVEKFVEDAQIQGKDVTPDMSNPKLTIQFGDLSSYGSSVIGLCQTGTGVRTVTFNPTFWNAVDDTQRELLTHHELGHCVLYRSHKTTLLPSGEYASIMYPVIMSDSTYMGNYAYYQNELFTQTELSSMAPQTHICTTEDVGLPAAPAPSPSPSPSPAAGQ